MSRAHGISGFITLLNTIKILNINVNIPQSLIEDLENLIDKTYIEFNQEAFWYPFVLNDQKEMKRIGNYDFFKSQKYFWCSGTLGMNIAYYKFAKLFHLTKLISKCKVVENSLKGKFFLPNNNYNLCHGYSGPYIALKKHSISLDLSYQNAIINYVYKMRLSQNKDYAFIDGKISTIFALLICDDSNSSIEEFLKVIFFQN